MVEVEGDEEGGCFFEIYGWEIDKEGRGVGDTGFGGHGDRLDSGRSGKLSELLKMLCGSSIDGMKAGKDVNYYTHHSTFTSS